MVGTERRTPFLIITDHKALEYFGQKRLLNDRQIRWTEDLANFHYRITYRPGKENHQADALSRKVEELKSQKAIREAARTALMIQQPIEDPTALPTPTAPVTIAPTEQGPPSPQIAEGEIETRLPHRPQGCDLVDQILQANRISRHTEIEAQYWTKAEKKQNDWNISEEGLLKFGNSLYVPAAHGGVLRTYVIEEVHARMPTAHPGRDKTRALLRAQYYWPTILADVAQYLRNCRTCRRSHEFKDKKPGLLQPLPIPDRPWQDISIDFKEFPPDRKGFDNLFVTVCRLSKRAISIPCSKKATAQDAAWMYYQHPWRFFGTPRTVTSDRGPQFVGDFFDELCKNHGRQAEALHIRTQRNQWEYRDRQPVHPAPSQALYQPLPG